MTPEEEVLTEELARLRRWLQAIATDDPAAEMGMAHPKELCSLGLTWLMLGGMALERGKNMVRAALPGRDTEAMRNAAVYYGMKGETFGSTVIGDEEPEDPPPTHG